MAGKAFKCPSCREPFVVEIQQKPASRSKKTKRRQSAPKFVEDDDISAGPPPIVMGKKPKTKKREQEPQDEPTAKPKQVNKVALVSVIGVAAIVLWTGVIFFIRGFGGHGSTPQITAPVEFARTKANNSKFSAEAPSGWEVTTGGGSGGKPTWLKIKHEGITISIKENIVSGVLGDMAQAGRNFNEEIPDELAPVAKLHETIKGQTAELLSNYNEQPPVKIKTLGMGDGRMSEFTASEWSLGKAIYGYRVTLLAGPRQLNVLIKCPSKSHWEVLKPTFQQIVKSIQ